MRESFEGFRLDDVGTLAEIKRCHGACGEGSTRTRRGPACRSRPSGDPAVPMVTLATAHPAKFPDAVERAIGLRPALPPRLADLHERPERFMVIPAEVRGLKRFLRDHARVLGEAA